MQSTALKNENPEELPAFCALPVSLRGKNGSVLPFKKQPSVYKSKEAFVCRKAMVVSMKESTKIQSPGQAGKHQKSYTGTPPKIGAGETPEDCAEDFFRMQLRKQQIVRKRTATQTGGCHSGHRKRMRELFLQNGLQGLSDHAVLELLLFYAMPRQDTNALSHALISHFGSLSAVFDAEVNELQSVKGIGENAAVLIKFIPALCDRYSIRKLRKKTDFSSLERAADFFIDYYQTKTAEEVTALLLDANSQLISFEQIYRGSVNAAEVHPRKIAEIALKKNAVSIILAHNHPGGNAVPSDRDISTTKRLMEMFAPIELSIKAHLVIAGRNYTDIVTTIYDNAAFQVRYIAVK